MNITALRHNNHFLYWIAAALLLVSFGFADAAIVAWNASLVSSWQLFGAAFSFLLIAMGLFVTIWRMRREPK
jgi:hypothetical protein